MKHIRYSLTIYNETKKEDYGTLSDLDSLPRFEAGDHFDYHFFSPACDTLSRAIVTDVLYCFSGGPDQPELRVRLQIREMTIFEKGQIQAKHAG